MEASTRLDRSEGTRFYLEYKFVSQKQWSTMTILIIIIVHLQMHMLLYHLTRASILALP